MSLEGLKQDIETKQFRRLYYFYGSEPYLKRFYLKSLISALLPDNEDTDLHRYEGKQLDETPFRKSYGCSLWEDIR